MDCIQLKEIKGSNLFEVAEFAVTNHIQNENAFSWWVAKVLRHRNRIISKLKSKYWRKPHKFGIQWPNTVK